VSSHSSVSKLRESLTSWEVDKATAMRLSCFESRNNRVSILGDSVSSRSVVHNIEYLDHINSRARGKERVRTKRMKPVREVQQTPGIR